MEIGLTAETFMFAQNASVRSKKTEDVLTWYAQTVITHGAGYVDFQEDQKTPIMNLFTFFAQP